MPARKRTEPTQPTPGTTAPMAHGAARRLKVVAQSTLLAAGLAAARLTVDAEPVEVVEKLFSPGLVDRLRAPITRYNE